MTPAAQTLPAAPRGAPDRLWLVVLPSGERHHIDREPEGGIQAWAQGVNATILEYRFSAVVHRQAAKPKPKPR